MRMWTTVIRMTCLAALVALFACEGTSDAPTSPSDLVSGPTQWQSAAEDLTFDIKPGDCPNSLNPKSQGKTPVAIAGNSGLDVRDIDVESIRLEGVPPEKWSVEDTSSPGGCCDPITLFRVNAGGPLVAQSPAWTEDSPTSRSPYVNTGFAASTTETIDMSHPSIPPGTPMELFQSERWDFTVAPAMSWEFPASEGEYIVRLYFSENYFRNQVVGGRAFDVYLEGDLVLDDYDIFANVGGYAGIVEEFSTTVTDGFVTVEFAHVVENPTLCAIEVLSIGTPPPTDGIDDLVLKFETQDLVGALGALAPGDEVTLTLTGTFLDGTPFSDTDCVIIVGGGGGGGRSGHSDPDTFGAPGPGAGE